MAAERFIPRELQTLIAELQVPESEKHQKLLHYMFIFRAMLVGSDEPEQPVILDKFSFKIASLPWPSIMMTFPLI